MPFAQSAINLTESTPQVCPLRTTRKKIWIDLDNSPHVPFFAPIIQELEKLGHSVLLTARDRYQVRDLAALFNLKCRFIGRVQMANKLAKAGGLGLRSSRLAWIGLREKPDLAVSHGSRSQIVAASILGIPCISIGDYEHTARLKIIKATWVMVPEVIPDEALRYKKPWILKYPGIKEDVYAPTFVPDAGIVSLLGISDRDIVITARPPASEANYHSEESEKLFRASMELLAKHKQTKILLIPRNERQAETLRKLWPNLFASGKLIMLEHAVNGLNLIWHSDLVVSGGGTMNREAAALGVPVYSVFRGKTGAVDQYLAKSGRLILLESVNEVRTKLLVVKRKRQPYCANEGSRALPVIVNHLQSVLTSDLVMRQT